VAVVVSLSLSPPAERVFVWKKFVLEIIFWRSLLDKNIFWEYTRNTAGAVLFRHENSKLAYKETRHWLFSNEEGVWKVI
jgi:hypothetical protein